MSFLRSFGTKQERIKRVDDAIGLLVSGDVAKNIVAHYIDGAEELMNLSAKKLCEMLKDKKDGPMLIDLTITDADFLKHLLMKTAGTEKNKETLFWITENEGRHGQTVSEEVRNVYNGDYLVELCCHSDKLKKFLIENAERLKTEGLIDDEVIKDIKNSNKTEESFAAARPDGHFYGLR